MGTKDLTHEAISSALANGDHLTHEQRAALLGLVADDKVWQRRHDELAGKLAAERERCLHWCSLGDSDGYAAHHIREGTPKDGA